MSNTKPLARLDDSDVRALAIRYLTVWAEHPTWSDEKLCEKADMTLAELNVARNSPFVKETKRQWIEASEIAIRRNLSEQVQSVFDILLKIIKGWARNPTAAVRGIQVWADLFKFLKETDMIEGDSSPQRLKSVLPGGVHLTNIKISIGQAPDQQIEVGMPQKQDVENAIQAYKEEGHDVVDGELLEIVSEDSSV